MEIQIVRIEKPEDINFILGQSHFIKTVEDVHEALVTSVPSIKFGMALRGALFPEAISQIAVGIASPHTVLRSVQGRTVACTCACGSVQAKT